MHVNVHTRAALAVHLRGYAKRLGNDTAMRFCTFFRWVLRLIQLGG